MSDSQPRRDSDLLRSLFQFRFHLEEGRAPTDEATSLHHAENPLDLLRCRHVQGHDCYVEAACPILPLPARMMQAAAFAFTSTTTCASYRASASTRCCAAAVAASAFCRITVFAMQLFVYAASSVTYKRLTSLSWQ